jgi:hypothetical protein
LEKFKRAYDPPISHPVRFNRGHRLLAPHVHTKPLVTTMATTSPPSLVALRHLYHYVWALTEEKTLFSSSLVHTTASPRSCTPAFLFNSPRCLTMSCHYRRSPLSMSTRALPLCCAIVLEASRRLAQSQKPSHHEFPSIH